MKWALRPICIKIHRVGFEFRGNSGQFWTDTHVNTYINSRLVSMGVGKNYKMPSTTIITYSSRLVHIHTI